MRLFGEGNFNPTTPLMVFFYPEKPSRTAVNNPQCMMQKSRQCQFNRFAARELCMREHCSYRRALHQEEQCMQSSALSLLISLRVTAVNITKGSRKLNLLHPELAKCVVLTRAVGKAPCARTPALGSFPHFFPHPDSARGRGKEGF